MAGFNPFSAATGFEVFDLNAGGKKIDGGTFAPIQQPLSDAPLGNDVISREKSTTVKAGTDTGTETETKESRVNTGLVSTWVVRGTVIILGFIFVAVGLTMFATGKSATIIVKQGAGKVVA